MTRVVVDTDIFIDLLRTKRGDLLALFKLQEKQKVELYLSTVTIMEIFSGKSSQKEETDLLALLENFIVVPVTFEIAKLAGEIKRETKFSNLVSDLIIAATALSVGASIATRNRKHFSGLKSLKFLPGASSP